ncbi:MAG: putative hydroxymethylpyrimidine transporter CytX [Kiritimatiellae bacterium]|nr:putative hydroxymethylpyrimidine transporter CytX [Kiritimatiellia bacterium]
MNGNRPTEAHERNLRGRDFFFLWAGAGIALSEIWAGGILTPLGLVTGLVVILLGHIIGNTPLALAGLMGSRLGVPSMLSTRGALGLRGSHLPAILNVVQLVGWTAVMLWICGQAAARLTEAKFGLGPTPWILISGALTTLWALAGPQGWRHIQRIGSILLLILSVVMSYVLLTKYGLRSLLNTPASGGLSFMSGLDLVIAMPISWVPLAADYARFAKKSSTAFTGSWIGYFVASVWMYAVGLAASVATGSDTPDRVVMDLMSAFGLAGAALMIALISTFTTTFLDIYSNAVSLQSLAPRFNTRLAILLGGVLGTALATVLDPTIYEHFLLFIGSAFCPLFGVVFANYFITHRGHYDAQQLFGGERYRYWNGLHIPGLLAWLIGFALYQGMTVWLPSVGASLPSLLGAGLIYLALTARNRGAAAPNAERVAS